MAYCGDDDSAKQIAAVLISDVGFDPVDAGPLRIARYMEPFALLMGHLAYEGHGGPTIPWPVNCTRQKRSGGALPHAD